MIDFGTLLTVGLAFWVVAASPGPANIANASVAMQHGRKSSLIFGAGLSVGLMFWGGACCNRNGCDIAGVGWRIGRNESTWRDVSVLAGVAFRAICRQ